MVSSLTSCLRARAPLPGALPASRRGSILILVLALLSILLILATTLSFTSRLEMAATENFARAVQGRFAALGALPMAAAVFGETPEVTTFLQPWAYLSISPGGTAVSANSSVGQAGQTLSASTFSLGSQAASLLRRASSRTGPGPTPPDAASAPSAPRGPSLSDLMEALRRRHSEAGMADMTIQDESARVDLNRVGALGGPGRQRVADSPATLDFVSFLAAALTEGGQDPSQADSLARSIILWRLGPDGQPGVASTDDDQDSRQSGNGSSRTDDAGGVVIDTLGESQLSITHNGLDDNGDGVIDDDHEGAEYDGRDNDGDGAVDETLEGVDEPDEFQPDPRFAARGDDRNYERVTDLLQVPGITPEIFAALEPYVTVHSASETRAPAGQGGSEALVNINEADYDQILAQMKDHFPESPEGLLVQFTLNVLDARDPDHIPSSPPNTVEAHPPLGVERTPLINEVWPDSETDAADGDDGQYVEIINPYPDPFDLSGCELRVGAQRTPLTGTLPPQGFLIVTDDFDESRDDSPEDETPNYGSFVEIFGPTSIGSGRLLVVDPNFDLPDSAGTVELRDRERHLLDWFSYRLPPEQAGRRLSFQRDDPRVRVSELALCSPFEQNRNARPPQTFVDTYAQAIPADKPFATPVDLMFVFAGWDKAEHAEQRGWNYPVLQSSDGETLDSRLVDIFSVDPLEPLPSSDEQESVAVAGDSTRGPSQGAAVSESDRAEETPRRASVTGCEWEIGRINVNTAPRPALQALPGVSADLAQRILDWRAQVETTWRDQGGVASPFRHRGDLLRNDSLWGDTSLKDRLQTFRQFVNVLTTSSATLGVAAVAANERGRATPSTAPRAIAATLEIRDGHASLVTLDFPREGP
jgi:type II secretory pathway component PulK